MIELSSDQLPALSQWFVADSPGAAALAEHALISGAGRWWGDRAVAPRAVAVACADHLLLRGEPTALAPIALAPFAAHYVQAPALAFHTQAAVLENLQRIEGSRSWPACRGEHQHPMRLTSDGEGGWPYWQCPVAPSYRRPVGQHPGV
ncbi:hypothetical protein [Streptomyces tubercidicus]